MLPSFFLALREGLEAALIIGIVLGSLRQMKRLDLRPAIWTGVVSAAIVSLITAITLHVLGTEFEGRAEELFEGTAMLAAAGLLTWMIFWMQRQGSNLKSSLEADVRRAIFKSGATALFILAFLSVAREGLELALFLVAAQMTSTTLQTVTGAALGLALSALLGWTLFATTRRLSVKNFFMVTNVLLLFFAAGLVAHGVHEFNEAGWIPPVIEHVWDINGIVNENSSVGELLKALVGYNGNPSLTEVLAYLGYFAILGWVIVKNSKAMIMRSTTA